MSHIETVLVPAPVPTPRGAEWLADLFVALLRRAPASKEAAIAREANEAREFARGVRRTDPGFAADLIAAADRHGIQAAR